MTSRFRQPLAMFTSYAREDSDPRIELRKHLTPLIKQRRLVEWHDRLITAGSEWRNEIDVHLETAHIALLLISPDFLHSEYCYDVEMNRALERHREGSLRAVPVLLRDVYWRDEPFSALQVLPSTGHPVCGNQWPTRDAAFVDVVEGLRSVVAE